MRGDTINGYWGNVFHPAPAVPAPRDEWRKVEMMVACNDPVSSWNGEQAFWVNDAGAIHLGDGFPNGYWSGGHFYPDAGSAPYEGYQWRSTENLPLTFFWLSYYVTGGAGGVVDTVWFDDVVVSTERIGTTVGVTGATPETRLPSFSSSPNPFGRTTKIFYKLSEPSPVTLTVYDLSGRLVRRIEQASWKGAGEQSARWDGLDERGHEATPGVYFYSLDTGGERRTQKTILVR